MAVLKYPVSVGKASTFQQASGKLLVLDPMTETYVEVPGAGAMQQKPLPLDPRIDLTKPISEQVAKINLRKSSKSSKTV